MSDYLPVQTTTRRRGLPEAAAMEGQEGSLPFSSTRTNNTAIRRVPSAFVIRPLWLLAIPAGTYLLSYAYLAAYHGRANLWNTVVHEGGTYTFWETTFYASHFLGHVPVHSVIAVLFVGVCRWLLGASDSSVSFPKTAVGSALVFFLAGTVVLSIAHFGARDTIDFIIQHKQRDDLMVRGGAWNLHLASTMLLFAWVPVYIAAAARIFRRPFYPDPRGLIFAAAAAAGVAIVTVLANGGLLHPVAFVWKDPRHLAHSVREIVTFSATYFPIPLYVILMDRDQAPEVRSRPPRAVWVLGAVFAAAFAFQCWVPLSVGIGEIAQRPAFADGNSLSVAYLLASHFFEHVLDTAYFSLFALWLYGLVRVREQKEHD